MAAREQSGTNIDQGFVQRVMAGVRYAVSGVTPTDWFGPSQPLAPQAQEQTAGRAFDYPTGLNLRLQPRGEEAVSFAQLRGLADGYDLLRLVIETRKDQIEAFDWEIQPAADGKSGDSMAGPIKAVTDFLQRPDREHNWPQWLRMVVEEMLVVDTACVYPRASRGGQLYGFELVDGATIKRVLDVTGRTPLPPDPAYQQILKGIPAADYSSDDLVYMMRNPRVSRIYGFSPVEQVITTVNIAIRRQLTQLGFYTEGNIPEALAQVPASWSAKQIADFQTWWDSVMEGNLAQKRKMRFLPNLDNIVFPKSEVLKDEYDEWLARIVCFAFSISPSALIKQVNRASGQQMADTAKEEGLMPLLRFFEAFMTMLIQKHLKQPGLQFKWKIVNRVAPDQQATIHKLYIDSEVMTPDEVRESLEMDAMTPEQREAAWPTPVPPGMNADGTPILPKGAPGQPDPTAAADVTSTPDKPKPPAPAAAETPAEKMLADAIRMLDPSVIAKVMSEHVRALPPQIIEFKPETNIEVGDTNVHVPVARGEALDGGLAKRATDDRHAETMAAIAAVAERPHVINVAPAAVTVEAAQHHVSVAAPEVRPVFHVAAPAVTLEAPISITVPPAQVEVQPAAQGATEELIERNYKGDIERVVRKPLK